MGNQKHKYQGPTPSKEEYDNCIKWNSRHMNLLLGNFKWRGTSLNGPAMRDKHCKVNPHYDLISHYKIYYEPDFKDNY